MATLLQERVVPPPPEYPTSSQLWQVVPSTNSTGLISSVCVVDYAPLKETHLQHQNKCQIVGRVVQLGKRHHSVQFKVTRPGEKTLKLTLLNPDPRMKVGQMWSCTAILVVTALSITQSTCLETVDNGSTASLTTTTSAPTLQSAKLTPNRVILPDDRFIHTTEAQPSNEAYLSESGDLVKRLRFCCEDNFVDPAAPTDVALEALCLETGFTGWELSCTRQRVLGWEWEAVLPTTGQRARVRVGDGQGKLPQVYQYPVVSFSSQCVQPYDTQRLVVTPLGAALGIGASCFRVEIGPYEVVLDCGTRPKGYDPLPALDYLKNPDLLLISHAHQDHIGGVPVFHSRYPGVRMICTPGTREIAYVMLTDCLKVQLHNEDSPQLFDEATMERTLFQLETEQIGRDFEPLPGLFVRFINAGHIVGAACIYLRYGQRSLLYTGDYNTTSRTHNAGAALG